MRAWAQVTFGVWAQAFREGMGPGHLWGMGSGLSWGHGLRSPLGYGLRHFVRVWAQVTFGVWAQAFREGMGSGPRSPLRGCPWLTQREPVQGVPRGLVRGTYREWVPLVRATRPGCAW